MEEYFERCFKGPSFAENEDKKFEFRRLQSFQNWPEESPIFPIKLAKAGFYYTGENYSVKCFSCGTVKSDWSPGQDPLTCHQILNPDCEFIKGALTVNIYPFTLKKVI